MCLYLCSTAMKAEEDNEDEDEDALTAMHNSTSASTLEVGYIYCHYSA